jgi:hypothetical protein
MYLLSFIQQLAVHGDKDDNENIYDIHVSSMPPEGVATQDMKATGILPFKQDYCPVHSCTFGNVVGGHPMTASSFHTCTILPLYRARVARLSRMADRMNPFTVAQPLDQVPDRQQQPNNSHEILNGRQRR